MSALARLIHPDDAPALRPAYVPRSDVHERLEKQLHDCRQRRKEITTRLDALAVASPATTPAERQLIRDLQHLEAEIRAVRASLAPHRAAHLSAIKKVLAGPMGDAAGRALTALKAAETAVQELNSLRAEVRKFGGGAPDVSTKPMLMVQLPLRRLARGIDK